MSTRLRAISFPENDVFVPGNEGVGVVLAVGAGVTAFAEGDRVGYPMHVGAFAEERAIAADSSQTARFNLG